MNRYALPNNWRWTTLDEVAAPIPSAIADGPFGSNLKISDYVPEGCPVLQGKNITDDEFRWFDIRYISERKAHELRRSWVRAGDILIVKIGSIGYSAIADDLKGHECAVIPANLAKITPDLTKVDLRYLFRWLTSPGIKQLLRRSASQTAQPALSLSKLKEVPVPVPPIEEQRHIAAVLDKADALRAKRREAIVRIDKLPDATFWKMFGDLDSNPNRLPIVPLKALCLRVTDGTHQPPEWSPTGIPFLFVSNVVNGTISFSTQKFISAQTHSELMKRCPIEVGDILYTTVGSYGNAALVETNREFAFQRHIAHVKPDASKIMPEFLVAMLQAPCVRQQADRQARGVAQKTLNLAQLKEFQVFAPPVVRQRAFITIRRCITAIQTKMRMALEREDALVASLQHEVFGQYS